MAGKIAPTVDEVKAELRVDFDDDDDLIQQYIDAAANSCHADMYWINSQSQTLALDRRDFYGSCAFRLPFRGIGDTTLEFAALDDDGESITTTLDGSGVDYATSLKFEPNRYIPYLVPVKSWNKLFLNPKTYSVDLIMTPSDAPELILSAIRKMAVDCYLNNGMAPIPMVTAVERMLDPIRIYK